MKIKIPLQNDTKLNVIIKWSIKKEKLPQKMPDLWNESQIYWKQLISLTKMTEDDVEG